MQTKNTTKLTALLAAGLLLGGVLTVSVQKQEGKRGTEPGERDSTTEKMVYEIDPSPNGGGEATWYPRNKLAEIYSYAEYKYNKMGLNEGILRIYKKDGTERVLMVRRLSYTVSGDIISVFVCYEFHYRANRTGTRVLVGKVDVDDSWAATAPALAGNYATITIVLKQPPTQNQHAATSSP
jgi:hypothetical protein